MIKEVIERVDDHSCISPSSGYQCQLLIYNISRGWQFGNGMVFHLEDTKVENDSFFDRIAMKVDYGDVEVSAVQVPEKEAVQLDFFIKQKEEGRSKKMGNMLLPFFIGATKASALTILLGTVKLMVMKSLMITKIAVLVSAAILLCKYLKKSDKQPSYLEVDDHLPAIEYGGYGGTGSYSTNSFNYMPYNSVYPLTASDSQLSYDAVAPPDGNISVPLMKVVPAAKRRYSVKRKVVPTVVTIKKYVRTDS
ncbi:unnamed protein product [Phaedon cochleariae]|uniref:Uncharacterized protein n=1 Tax=Phaedon cochleariae TaxID=80249 RepID=A0A9P0DL21_PHACE|nr:unnamed protein product [Phaedon cochleariae]